MAHQFKVGDRVVIVRSPANPWTIGVVCSVVEGPFPATTPGAAGTLTIGKPVYRLDFVLPGCRLGAVAHPEWLEPLPNDGHEKAEWTEDLLHLCTSKKVWTKDLVALCIPKKVTS